MIGAALATLAIIVTACGGTESPLSSPSTSTTSVSEYPVPIPAGLRRYFEPAPDSAVCLPAPVWDGGDRGRQTILACELGWRMRSDVPGVPSVGGR